MTVVSVCLPSDALFQCLLSYWGFSYLGCGVSLHNAPAKLSRCSFHWMWVISLGLLLTLDLEYLTEEEDIKKRWQEYTEELYKKDLHDPDPANLCSSIICMKTQKKTRKREKGLKSQYSQLGLIPHVTLGKQITLSEHQFQHLRLEKGFLFVSSPTRLLLWSPYATINFIKTSKARFSSSVGKNDCFSD